MSDLMKDVKYLIAIFDAASDITDTVFMPVNGQFNHPLALLDFLKAKAYLFTVVNTPVEEEHDAGEDGMPVQTLHLRERLISVEFYKENPDKITEYNYEASDVQLIT